MNKNNNKGANVNLNAAPQANSQENEQANCPIASDTLNMADTQQFDPALALKDPQLTENVSNPQTTMAHFKIIDILGKGGMGAVYKAKDLALERFVAIKMLRINHTAQPLLLAEAKTVSQLNHPNIVTLYDIARDNDANFIVMEWVNGRALNSVIPPNGLSLLEVLAYAKQIVAALACAHSQHIIHRDIKPQNIMVDTNGQIKVLDFGIAALTNGQGASEAEEPLGNEQILTADKHPASAMLGSPQYMAPEQILGEESDARADLFSLGIVLYEMLTGVKPFLGLNIKQISQAITHGQYTPIHSLMPELNSGFTDKSKSKRHSDISPELATEMIAIVDTLLKKSPAARYQTAEALAQDLDILIEKTKQKNNWWQRQHGLTKLFIITPLIIMLGWSVRSVLFPPSTQELIARQLIESKKVAFLPFDNISGDPVLQIFSDGIATMLSSDLAEVGYQQGDGTTWVLPASEIRQLDDPTVAGIYNKYGVDFIINGSIQHMGSTRSIHLSLVNGADGRQLKSVQLTINATKLFEAQTQIRQQVIELLGWQIPPALKQQFAKHKPTFDGAYKHYLQGQGYLYRFDHGDNIDKALTAFQAAIALDPNYGDAYVGLAQTQLQHFIESNNAASLKAIADTVEQLTKIAPHHPLLSYLQGELARNQGDYIKAIVLFSDSIKLQPNDLMAYLGLSGSFLQQGNLNKAEEMLLMAYNKLPNNSLVLINLGAFHFDNGNYTSALDYFNLLAEQTPNNYIAYLNMSACYYLNGDIKQAILAARKALNIQPNAMGYSNLGTYHFILKDYINAVTAFENMIALNDSDFINWGNLADAYRFANNGKYLESFKRAIVLAEQALELNPNNKYAIALLAYYYANINNLDRTHYYAKRINQDDLGEHLFFVSAAYARLKMKTEAFDYLTLSIKNNYSIAEISSSPLLDDLRSELKYQQLIAKEAN